MFGEARFAAAVGVGWVCEAEAAAVPTAGVDGFLDGLPLALDAEDFGVVADADFGPREVDEDFDAGWEFCLRSRNVGGVVGDDAADAGVAGFGVRFKDQGGGVAVGWLSQLRSARVPLALSASPRLLVSLPTTA